MEKLKGFDGRNDDTFADYGGDKRWGVCIIIIINIIIIAIIIMIIMIR